MGEREELVTTDAAHLKSGSVESQQWDVEELRQGLILALAVALLAAGGAGLWWFLQPGQRQYDYLWLVSLSLFVQGCLTVHYRQRHPLIARTILLIGPVISLALALAWVASPIVPYCACFVVIAGAAFDPFQGLAAAALCTLALLATAPRNEHLAAAILFLWATFGVAWLSSRSLLTVLGWAWTSQERANRLLEELRDHQEQLNRTLAALTESNRRLERINEQLAVARMHAEEARRLQEQFAANISHELRTPLNLIVGFSEMMATKPRSYGGVALPAAYRGDVMAIYRSARHLSNLINDVLDLSQIQADHAAVRREPEDLADVVREAIEMIREVAEARGLRIELNICNDLPPLRLDRTRIRQVLLNLLANAVRFTSQGWIRIAVHLQGTEALITVQDTGCGISPAKLSRAFEPFSQLGEDPKREGSGLGLALSKRFVELHGGRMWIESQEGLGTRVSFALPVPKDSRELHASMLKAGPTPRSQQQPLVLLLHNDPRALSLLQRFVDGYQFVAAESPAQARERIAELLPAAVVIDSFLGQSEDVTPARLGVSPETPVLTCPLPSLRHLGQLLGVADFLPKPVTYEDLAEALSRLQKRPQTVLVVDDEAHMVRLLARMLKSWNPEITVLETFSGQQALEVAQAQCPDLMLLDLFMPGMDGLALLQEIRRDARLVDMRAIVISARAMEREAAPAMGELHFARAGGFSLAEVLQVLQVALPVLTRTVPANPARGAASAAAQPG